MSDKVCTLWCQRVLSGRCVNNCAAYTMYTDLPGGYQSYVRALGGIIVLTGLFTHTHINIYSY